MSDRPSLSDSDWFAHPATQAVFGALEAARPGATRFVGGCVRNWLMNKPTDDIDIATQLLPADVVAALQAAGLRAIPTGLEHGTITAICDHRPFEITTLRRDVETDGRRAVVAFTEDWNEDAARRDFRLNALYVDGDGTLHDPTGGGVEDALAGRVIFIGDGDQRLQEDYLRILRFFRFNAWYGADIDADGLAACARQSAGLKSIAAERVWKEMKKLLSAPSPYPAMVAMTESGVLDVALPMASNLTWLSKVQDRTRDPVLRLMSLLAREDAVIEAAVDHLRLPNSSRKRMLAWARCLYVPGSASTADLKTSIYRDGVQAVKDRLQLSPNIGGDTLAVQLNAADAWVAPTFPVTGEDAKSAGLAGPAIGAALRELEDWWIAQDFAPTREQLLARLSSQ